MPEPRRRSSRSSLRNPEVALYGYDWRLREEVVLDFASWSPGTPLPGGRLRPSRSRGEDRRLGEVGDLERRFANLRERWLEETRSTSSISEIAMNPAYQQIIGMGSPVLPLIFRDLEKEPDHWFWALKAITGEDPVPTEDRGRLSKMARAWVEWARAVGFTW